jgi:hypothetical protein
LVVSSVARPIYADRMRRVAALILAGAVGLWVVGCGDDSKYTTDDPTVSMPSGAAGDAPVAGAGGAAGAAAGAGGGAAGAGPAGSGPAGSTGAAGEVTGAAGSSPSDGGQD